MVQRRRILVVDDQVLLALDVADVIEEQGHEVVGPFTTVDQALSHVKNTLPDTAILDINLGQGQTTEPIAKALMAGDVPFAFLTGYGDVEVLPEEFARIERLRKPAQSRDISNLLDRLLTISC